MKKYIMLAVFAAFAAAANAQLQGGSPPGNFGGGPGGFGGGNGGSGGFMQNLTDEQKECMSKAECPEMARPQQGAEPDEAAKVAMNEARECQRKAMEDCGIEMPKPQDGQGGNGGGRGRRRQDSGE